MKNENKLLTSDYISIGVFSLIYFVIAFVIGGIAQMIPVTFLFMLMVVTLFKDGGHLNARWSGF